MNLVIWSVVTSPVLPPCLGFITGFNKGDV
jgi:hypothetical protein